MFSHQDTASCTPYDRGPLQLSVSTVLQSCVASDLGRCELHAVSEPHTSDRRYVWLNLDMDLLDKEITYLAYLVTMAASIKPLNFSREVAGEWWYDFENDTLSAVVIVEEIPYMWFASTGSGIGETRSPPFTSRVRTKISSLLTQMH
jgi:siroheme synthase (precorrin-2 oxidase/ferrochelatase)